MKRNQWKGEIPVGVAVLKAGVTRDSADIVKELDITRIDSTGGYKALLFGIFEFH